MGKFLFSYRFIQYYFSSVRTNYKRAIFEAIFKKIFWFDFRRQ